MGSLSEPIDVTGAGARVKPSAITTRVASDGGRRALTAAAASLGAVGWGEQVQELQAPTARARAQGHPAATA